MARKDVRDQLVSLFTANGSFNAVLGYSPNALGAATTKVLAIYSRRTRHQVESKDLRNDFYTFNLDVLVKRTADATHEDTLDALHEVVRAVVRANIGDANWSHLDLDENSDAFYGDVQGVAYRVERHVLSVKVSAT